MNSEKQPPENINMERLDFIERHRERELEAPLHTTFFGKRFASLQNFFTSWHDKIIWGWLEADVLQGQQKEKENALRKSRPKLRKDINLDPDQDSNQQASNQQASNQQASNQQASKQQAPDQ